MSDPTARRGDAISKTLEWMRKKQKVTGRGKKRGFTKSQIKRYLFSRYRYGVREQTLDLVFKQLLDYGLIYGEYMNRSKTLIHYFAYPEKDGES